MDSSKEMKKEMNDNLRRYLGEIWDIADNIAYGKTITKKQRKEVSERLHALHDLIAIEVSQEK